MRIDIQSPHLDVTEPLELAINEKVGKLGHFFENILDAIVYLHDRPQFKELEIKLNVPNDTLFVREQGENFEAALDIAYDTMKRQLTRYKERNHKK
ncbi:MAG: ribosome-associated translation inhibitor RaiA [Bacteroidota bacterium]|nr:ribosome-associated translation inhibitor RaiA [Bacteroidota bacterium]